MYISVTASKYMYHCPYVRRTGDLLYIFQPAGSGPLWRHFLRLWCQDPLGNVQGKTLLVWGNVGGAKNNYVYGRLGSSPVRARAHMQRLGPPADLCTSNSKLSYQQ